MTTAGHKLDVLVAGAGPTGLIMALALARHGVRCRVVDKAAEPSVHSKALAVHARTLEALEALGVAAPMLGRGLLVRGLPVHAGGRPLARLSLESMDSRHNYILSLEQSETERLLIEQLARLGVVVARPVELLGFSQDATGVSARLRRADGSQEASRAGWLIGCDGAHSAVRHGLGLAFEGAAYEDDFRLADLRIDWPLAADWAHAFLRRDGPLGVIPLPGSYQRVITILPKPEPGAAAEAPSLDFFRQLLAEGAPAGTRLHDPVWLAGFRIHRPMVERYRVGRVLLAGDAAHIHSPAGGQGMNTGIQDAVNLAWKLALVLRGQAGEALLDSYQAERLPVARSVLRATDLATRSIRRRGRFSHWLRRFLIPRLAGQPGLRRRFANTIGNLTIRYRRSAFVAGRGAGERLPDAGLAAANGTAMRLHEALDHQRHSLLLLPRADSPPRALEALTAIAASAADLWSYDLSVLWVFEGNSQAPPAHRATRLSDPQGALHDRLGASVILVRPDGYIGYGAGKPDPAALEAYLARLFDRSNPNVRARATNGR